MSVEDGVKREGEKNAWEPRIVAFLCNWCSYAGADLAGVSRLKYPANVRIIRVPCSSRVNPQFILRAFQRGADGVLVAGCHPGDCHYVTGNYFTRRRLALFKRLLEFTGFMPERLKVRWVSAAEGSRFAETVKEMVEELKDLGPNLVMREGR
uniref:Hydrogenase iron-sulfur subunit n=1 Tax=Ammonifex degensii TaxID=42838 RepID=A0A7C1JN16_9THEO